MPSASRSLFIRVLTFRDYEITWNSTPPNSADCFPTNTGSRPQRVQRSSMPTLSEPAANDDEGFLGRVLSELSYLCHTDIGMAKRKSDLDIDTARNRLIEAEQEYQRARVDDYVSRLVRDSAIVDAHRAGLSSSEISKLVGDIGQPNVVRARRRAMTRRELVPKGLLSPADAVRESGLGPKDFILAVREGRLASIELPGGVRAFRVEDVRSLQSAS